MDKKTLEYLSAARTWVDKNADGDVDTKPVAQALSAADKAARDADDLRERLAAATRERNVSLLVLQETLKSAKHAQKAVGARAKADKKAAKAKARPTVKGKGKPKATSG